MEMLECPACHGKLKWTIYEGDGKRIENGEAVCMNCGAEYPVKNGIGIFLTSKFSANDLWKQGSTKLTQFFNEHPEIEKELMEAPAENMSAADTLFRAMLLEERGQVDIAGHLYCLAAKNAYTEDYVTCWNRQYEYVCNMLKGEDGPIVDLASGRCHLVDKLLQSGRNYIVATDFSPSVLRRDKESLKHRGLYDRVTLLAFDARLTPFKDGAVKILTTNLGLPNIENAGELLKELRRIISGEFLAVTHFYPESDGINRKAIEDAGLEIFLYEGSAMGCFAGAGFDAELLNQCTGLAQPTPVGKIVEGATIDTLPVSPVTLKWGTIKAV